MIVYNSYKEYPEDIMREIVYAKFVHAANNVWGGVSKTFVLLENRYNCPKYPGFIIQTENIKKDFATLKNALGKQDTLYDLLEYSSSGPGKNEWIVTCFPSEFEKNLEKLLPEENFESYAAWLDWSAEIDCCIEDELLFLKENQGYPEYHWYVIKRYREFREYCFNMYFCKPFREDLNNNNVEKV